MTRKYPATWCVVLASCLAAMASTAACRGGADREVLDEPVAIAGDRAVTRAELDDYLSSHLQMEGEEDWEPEAVTAEVKSRLLDELIREILLSDEARKTGIRVTSPEIDAWIAGGPEDHRLSKSEETRRRERAEREILVQKILEATARFDPSPEAIDTLIARVYADSPIRVFPEKVPFPYVPEPVPEPGP